MLSAKQRMERMEERKRREDELATLPPGWTPKASKPGCGKCQKKQKQEQERKSE